jgi:peptide/nickel transport system permease protein
MSRYMLQRIFLLIPTLLGVTVIVFALLRLIPGGAVSALLGENATPEQAQALTHALGLDQPIPVQYVHWLGGVLHGDLGTSLLNKTSVSHEIGTRIGWTFELGAFALLFSLIIALPIGILAALRQDSAMDYLARSSAIAFLAIPSFWLATLLIVYGAMGVGIGDLSVHFTPPLGREINADLGSNLRLVIPPALILGIGLSGSVMRLTRTQMLEVMRQDYVRTAQAKGLHTRSVIAGHAMRNALIPIVTIVGLQIPVLVGGSVVLEQIFSLPGMGYYLVQSVSQRDITVIQGVVLVTASLVLLANLLVDFSYSALDPRIRHE